MKEPFRGLRRSRAASANPYNGGTWICPLRGSKAAGIASVNISKEAVEVGSAGESCFGRNLSNRRVRCNNEVPGSRKARLHHELHGSNSDGLRELSGENRAAAGAD